MEAQGLTVSSADGVRRMDFHRQGRLQFPEWISLRRGFQKGGLDLDFQCPASHGPWISSVVAGFGMPEGGWLRFPAPLDGQWNGPLQIDRTRVSLTFR